MLFIPALLKFVVWLPAPVFKVKLPVLALRLILSFATTLLVVPIPCKMPLPSIVIPLLTIELG